MGKSILWSIFLISLIAGACCECDDFECDGPHEEIRYTGSYDRTCDGPGDVLDEPAEICKCVSGYVRHEGKCIRLKECPRCFKENEEYMYTDVEDHTCDAMAKELDKPIYACRCVDGFVRNDAGECIKAKDCPPKCTQEHEEYIKTNREDKTCDGRGLTFDEPVFACRCKHRFVRHENKCIKRDRCPMKCTKANEEYVLAEREDDSCTCEGAKMENPQMACRCKEDFVRNDKGYCMPRSKCPAVKCTKDHEEYVTSYFEEDTCEYLGDALDEPVKECRCKSDYVRNSDGECILFEECPDDEYFCEENEELILTDSEDATCDGLGAALSEPEEACRCIGGYVRDEDGYCIPAYECPMKCVKKHEVYTQTSYTDATCDGPAQYLYHEIKDCRCIDGYVRDDEDNCVEPSECPLTCSLPNEVLEYTIYEDDTCDGHGDELDDVVLECRCESGYVRDDDGNCIPYEECAPKCENPNEEYILTKRYDMTCNGLGAKLPKAIHACRCIGGYVRNYEGICMPVTDCPLKCSLENEKYTYTKREEDTCDGPGEKLSHTIKACRCIEGFVRNSDGQCIRRCDCPLKCTKLHEIYVITHQEDSTCTQSGAMLDHAVEACRCKEGFVRDFLGNCIRECDCPRKCSKPNEGMFKTKHAEKTCFGGGEKLNNSVRECRCKDGFVRHEGHCIEACNCPYCGENEAYVKTSTKDATCLGAGQPLNAPEEGCRCNDGYVRYNGKCIPANSCPSCGANATYVSTLTQDNTCTGLGAALPYEIVDCRCLSGFVRYKGECITTESCPICPVNEQYVFTSLLDPTCTTNGGILFIPTEACRCNEGFVRHNGICIHSCNCPVCRDPFERLSLTDKEDATCMGPGKPLPAEKEICLCDTGYVRYNGTCIDPEFCPQCYGQNETLIMAEWYDSTCAVLGTEMPDHLEECRCKEGHVRHHGVCIKKEDCPACADNEEYILGHVKDRTCSEMGCVIEPPEEGCFCKSGYVRHNGTCILLGECPTCPLNEVYLVTDKEDDTCAGPGACLPKPSAGCKCQTGLVRLNGVCVSPSVCPTCGSNQTYIFSQSSDPTCTLAANPFASPVEGCYCVPDYLRYKGACIHADECPLCLNQHEHLVHTAYEDSTCTVAGALMPTPGEECRCLIGYVRRDGSCILRDECPKCPGDNEAFIWAESEDPTCTKNAVAMNSSQEACRCLAGYVRHNDSCILPGQCPGCPGAYEVLVTTSVEDETCTGPGAQLAQSEQTCRCQDGFVRHNGVCILRTACPSCPAGEEYRKSNVSDDSCTVSGTPIDPPSDACYCLPDYVRHNGVCIPSDKCPVCASAVETLIRAVYEDPTCSEDGAPMAMPMDACRCNSGYVRYGGQCIKKSDCPVCTGVEETLIYALYEDPTCTVDNGALMATPIDACRCNSGFVRHDGQCIQKSECPVVCNENEEYVLALFTEPACGEVRKSQPPVKECRCLYNYGRNGLGKCELCPSVDVVT